VGALADMSVMKHQVCAERCAESKPLRHGAWFSAGERGRLAGM